MKTVICIRCPIGCTLQVDEEHGYAVTGNRCEKGAAYGKDELINPMRMVTSTVRLVNAAEKRCPVRTSAAVPKAQMMEVMRALDTVTATAPVQMGQVLLANVCGTGTDIIATRSILQ